MTYQRYGEFPERARDIFPELAGAQAIKYPQSSVEARYALSKPQPKIEPTAPIDEPAIRVTTLDFTNIHRHGELFVNYLKARRETFIDQKGWDLPQVAGMEFDQYDTPMSKWVVLHEYGEILAGIRLTPTTAQCGQSTYMIKDAQDGLLPTIPRTVLFFEAPVNDKIWEATRLFVSPKVTAKRRAKIQTILMQQMGITARSLGCSYIIGIVPAVFHRWCKRIGMSAFPAGPVMVFDGDRSQAAMMKMKQFAADVPSRETGSSF